MNKNYLNTITNGDCIEHLKHLETESIDLFLSDIPYGINFRVNARNFLYCFQCV